MGMRRAFLFAGGVAVLAGCTHDSLLLERERVAPPFSLDPPDAIPIATATPLPSADRGDGHDGALVVGTGGAIVSTCKPVVTASGNAIEVAVATGFVEGRRVLLHQVQGQFAAVADANPIAAESMGSAGTWQIVRITSVVGTTLTVSDAIVGTFESGGTARAQACTMPEYTTVEVAPARRMVAEPWDGAAGGVIAFFANDRVTIDGAIAAGAAGFRGGVQSSGGGGSDVTFETTDSVEGGGRGESLDVRSYGEYGRGNRANGGGGGNGHNAGGGGGANAGIGGFGGFQGESNPADPNTRGRPGQPLASAGARLVFGGGGGGGHQDNSGSTPGGSGGGIILIIADTLAGNGTVDASGANAFDSGGFDGAGGGGAGGMLVVHASANTFAGTFRADGGMGGTAQGDPTYCGGPGGGGGGGAVLVAGSSGTATAAGGLSGFLQDDDAASTWGAEAGAAGVVTRLVLVE